ncbi:MAG: hypothetical protein AAGA16_07605, partial [Cyanobacteria bacterium P01_E01_bin.35]
MTSDLQKGLIRQGDESIAIAKIEGAIYRIEPIPEVQSITFHNLTANESKIFDLRKYLTYDYEILGIEPNYAVDDDVLQTQVEP